MPKAAPTQVIVHRIELQETERSLLEAAVASYSVRNVSRAVFNLTSNVTTVILVILVYEQITGKKILNEAFYASLGVGGDLLTGLIDSITDYRAIQAELGAQDNWRTGGQDEYFGQSLVELLRTWFRVPEGGY